MFLSVSSSPCKDKLLPDFCEFCAIVVRRLVVGKLFLLTDRADFWRVATAGYSVVEVRVCVGIGVTSDGGNGARLLLTLLLFLILLLETVKGIGRSHEAIQMVIPLEFPCRLLSRIFNHSEIDKLLKEFANLVLSDCIELLRFLQILEQPRHCVRAGETSLVLFHLVAPLFQANSITKVLHKACPLHAEMNQVQCVQQVVSPSYSSARVLLLLLILRLPTRFVALNASAGPSYPLSREPSELEEDANDTRLMSQALSQ